MKNSLMNLHRNLRQPVYSIDRKFGPAWGDRYMAAIRPLRKAIAFLGGFGGTNYGSVI